MHGYATAGWENFFVAEVGAAAALTGLLFVAVSINLSKILSLPQLPGRAGESLVILMGVLATASFGLVPGQSREVLGAEILAIGALAWGYPIRIQIRGHVAGVPRRWMVARVVAHQIATLPMLTAGATLLIGAGGGLYWLIGGTILSFAAAIVNAWVLLIEIQR
jgi:hypothetical protein